MKKAMKKIVTLVLAITMVCGGMLFAPQATTTVEAAGKPAFSTYSQNLTATYKPGNYYAQMYATLSINNCRKATSVKNLKSSNTSVARVKVGAGGVINVYYFKKAGTTTISATVNGTKISTKFTVKKYSSPVKSFKVGKTSFASKYKTYDEYTWYHTGKVSGKTFSVAANSGWKISDVYLNYSHVFNAYYV